MSQPSGREEDAKRPVQPVLFGVGLALMVFAVASIVVSAFADSSVFNTLGAALIPGSVMTVYGWRGSIT